MRRNVLIGLFLPALLVIGLASSAAAQETLGPPHDSSNGVECLDCHALGSGELGVSKARGTEQELLCKSCHNPTGPASTMTDVGLHITGGGTTIVDCGSCHSVHYQQITIDPHAGGATAPNLSLVRGDTAAYIPGALEPAIFQVKPDHFFFAAGSAPYNGICQSCHQNTAYHRNDGTGDYSHGGGAACTECHGHKSGFAGSCVGCHGLAQDDGNGLPVGGRRALASEYLTGAVHAHSGGASIGNADCAVCHSGATHMDGAIDLVGPDDGALLTFEKLGDAIAGPGLSDFCAACHDADGAVGAGTPLDPFGSGTAPADIAAEYFASGHADAAGEPFVHWDGSGAVQATCARCHSEGGFLDILGADGSPAGTVEGPAAIGTWVTCMTCHNAAATTLSSVTFPSGVEVTGLGPEARCMMCHQGRESTVSVDARIATAAPVDDDTVTAGLSFRNVHYFAAGATLYGGDVQGGYEYAGMAYDGKFQHEAGLNTCMSCHDPHSLEVKVSVCATCHPGVATVADLHDVRMPGSLEDYDGDGDVTEGIAAEVEALHALLLTTIQAYANDVLGTPIVYNPASHPYWFDGGGVAYASWTARLMRATYNYQYVMKDPGAFAHNGKYVIELLYDSIMDVNGALPAPADLSALHRMDAGHFQGTAEAWRHWDGGGEVQAGCARCHSATGVAEYLATGANTAAPLSNGMLCSTCHDAVPDFSSRYAAAQVTFPSGNVVDSGNNDTNLCMSCHQGRESGVSVQTKIEGLDEDTVSASLRFLNVHYFAAGATRYGAEANGAYEYPGKAYNGYFAHTTTMGACADCHDVHTQGVQVDTCGACHEDVTTLADLEEIRMPGSTVDYDGDGLVEGIAGELDDLRARLYAGMQTYSSEVLGDAIVYNAASYPYFFTSGGASWSQWTPRLLKAAYNFQYATKDPGAFAHNARYIVQILFDSLEDLSLGSTVDMTGLTRDAGKHFNGASEAFRHWDGDGAVSASCARCHGGEAGLDAYVSAGYTGPAAAVPVAYGMTCETCHTGADYAGSAPRKYIEKVVFPSAVEINNTPGNPDDSFLCMTCHQGRVAKAKIDQVIAGGTLSFQNVHYLPAGATLYGGVAQVGYEYAGKTYNGKWNHWGGQSSQCTFCHEVEDEGHTFHPQITSDCQLCHGEATVGDVTTIRFNRPIDYDANPATTTLRDDIAGLAAKVYAQMQVVAAAAGTPLAYDAHAYPYFFADSNGNGVADAGEPRFASWTPTLLKASHNYQLAIKEPGAWAHNTAYIAQLLYDSLEDLGGDLTGLTRP